MSNKALRAVSVLGIFAAVFPFAVLYEGVCYGEYIWWHYLVVYAALAVFYGVGNLCSAWANAAHHSREFRPKARFLSRAAILIPTIAFLILSGIFEMTASVYLYILPACLVVYKGGYSAANRDYTEIFGRGWFALFFVCAVGASILLWFTRDDAVISQGGFQLCFAFGAVIVISAVLTNQTNIDSCTQQRDSGKMALPKGLRSYNAYLCAGVTAVTVALFLFAPALARFVADVIKKLIALILMLIRGKDYSPAEDDVLSSADGGGNVFFATGDNLLMELLYIVVGAVVIYVIIRYRRQIAAYIRELFSFMYREREESGEAAYHDEFSPVGDVSKSFRSGKRLEQQLYKEFIKERDAAKKYRIGYRLMLVRLGDTPFSVIPTDNTDIHRIKGESGLRSEKVQKIVSVYNKVRYSGYIPNTDEISFAEGFIEDIRRKI